MFRKLHRQMALFCALATSSILVAMTVLCLFLSERSMRETLRRSFINDVNSVIFYLEHEVVISHQQLIELEQGHYLLRLYDNGSPLLHNALDTGGDTDLFQLAIDTAIRDYQLDITTPDKNLFFPKWQQFSLQDQAGQNYFAATAIFPRRKTSDLTSREKTSTYKENGVLGAVVLLSLAEQDRQFASQRLLFAGFDLAGGMLLLIFAWFFVKKLLRPVEETRQKQVQFVAAASHELRSPLTVMLSNLSALERAGPQERPLFQRNIRTEGLRMARLIDDLLALANADSHSWSICRAPTELDTLALELYEKYSRPAREKGLRLTITLPEEGLPPTQCDGGRVEQAVSALISNALSYTPQGGKVDIILTQLSGGRMMFTVQDNGPGIPDKEKPLIFQRFYRSDPSRQDREHFGLGLCVAQEIALLHRGKLWVEDTPGGGARFKLII